MKEKSKTHIKKAIKSFIIVLAILIGIPILIASCVILNSDSESSSHNSVESSSRVDIDGAYNWCLKRCGGFPTGADNCLILKEAGSEDGLYRISAYCDCVNKNNVAYCDNKFG